jgi:hypothetical protein
MDHITFQESTVLGEITKAVRDRKPLHLVPLVRNFLAVDLILYDPDGRPARSPYLYSNHNEYGFRYRCLGSSVYSKLAPTTYAVASYESRVTRHVWHCRYSLLVTFFFFFFFFFLESVIFSRRSDY